MISIFDSVTGSTCKYNLQLSNMTKSVQTYWELIIILRLVHNDRGCDWWPTKNGRLRRMNCKEGHVKSSKRLEKHIISIISETSKGVD